MTDCAPTGRLRFVKRGGHWAKASPHDQKAVRVGAVNILQQEWRLIEYRDMADVETEDGWTRDNCEWRETTEWRDVPVEAE